MKDLLDPWGLWLVRPGTARSQSQGDAAPVAVDDVLSVPRTSGPVTVAVLANDIDPEEQPLTLISASAALGTAVANPDNTVTYTPPQGTPPGVVAFDTVVYEIADATDQRDTGQIDVTIAGPDLQINVTPEGTLAVIADTAPMTLTVTDPPAFAGTYIVDVTDLATGPVTLAAPVISGTSEVGDVLTATDGLWIHDTAGTPVTQTWQWQRAGADIPGETGTSYTVQPGDDGQGLAAVETLSDGFGTRSATSAAVALGFRPGDDAGLIGWWDAADAATVSDDGSGNVTAWADKAGGDALAQPLASHRPVSGARTLKGHNVIDFDGSHFMTAPRSWPATGDFAMHAALIIDTTNNAFEALFALEATNDFQLDANTATQFDGRLNAAGIGPGVSLTGGPFAGPLILSMVFDRTGHAQAEVFIGNTSRGTMAYTTPVDASAALHLMTNRSANAWVDGAVGELIVTDDVSNRTNYQDYLSAKWEIF